MGIKCCSLFDVVFALKNITIKFKNVTNIIHFHFRCQVSNLLVRWVLKAWPLRFRRVSLFLSF